MPPLLPDEATKAQETFRLGDRFYVEEHGLVLGELIGINDTWLRFRDVRSIESQDKLDSMQYSGIYLLTQPSELEYVRNCVLVVIGKPNICCIQKLYNYSGNIYKYRVKWYSNTWGNWQTVSLT